METLCEKVDSREWLVCSNQGQQIFGVLHRPQNQAGALCPVVVTLHGFASHKVGTNRSSVLLAEELAKQGIATLRFDFRGSGDSEGHLSEIAFEDFISDVMVVLKELEQIEGIDCSRLGFYGSSLGGAIAVIAAQRSNKVSALALWAPVASGQLWIADWMRSNPELATQDPREGLKSYRGVPLCSAFQEQFGLMSATESLKELGQVPLLHMHGEQDKVVSIRHQLAYELVRKGASAVSEFITYPEAEHFLGYQKVLGDVLLKTANWFKKVL